MTDDVPGDKIYHYCERPGESEWDGREHAVDTCEEAPDGKMFCFGPLAATQVNFCPFCGYKARTPVRRIA